MLQELIAALWNVLVSAGLIGWLIEQLQGLV